MTRWPNLFIAGAPRCGTTSLHVWLPAIPGIFMSRIKEPNFFLAPRHRKSSSDGQAHPGRRRVSEALQRR